MATRRRIGYRTAGSTSFPAPVGGLNDRDPLASMPKEDAVILENWWVEPSRLVVRDGYADFADGFTGPVETITEYAPASGVNTVFAASDGSIYDVTSGGTFNIPLDVYRSDWQGTQLLYTTPRTNILRQSVDLSVTPWSSATYPASASLETTPRGDQTSWAVIPNLGQGLTAGGRANICTKSSAVSQQITLSVFAKQAGFNKARLYLNGANTTTTRAFVDFSLDTGAATLADVASGFTGLTYGSVDYGNGWWFLYITTTTDAAATVTARLYTLSTVATVGDGVSGVCFWLPQVENSAVPTSRIDTAATTVTVTDYAYTPPQTVMTSTAPISGATMLVRNTTGGLTAFGTGNGSQTIFTLPDVSVFGMADVTGMTNNRWQPAQIATAGGNFLYLFNGVDDPQLYDGTSWQAVNSGSSPIAITGVTTSTLVQGCVFKNRLFMVERASSRVWYLPVSSIGGTAVAFDLGAIFQRGGYLVGMYTWTIDAGSGADDHAVFISSEGEVVVYSGNDPSTAANWNMIGLFYLGKPIGRRCAVKFGGDLLIICETGVMPLGRSLLSSAIDRRASIVDKIQNSVNAAVTQYRNNFGWELCVHPKQNALILNIPAGQNYQFVQNTISEAWTKFTGWNAITFADTQQGLLYGDSDSIKHAWEGKVDGETMVVADALQSFQSFGSPAENKYFTMVRPFLRSDGAPSILYAINGDYAPQEPTGVLSFSPPTGMIWGQMVWGSMTWGGEFRQLGGWNTVGGVYYAAALRMKVQSNASTVEWASTSFVFQPGGLL